jgi:hypothetical protein
MRRFLRLVLPTLKFIHGRLSNENRLLLSCARKVLTAQHLDEACSVIAGGLDWNLLDRSAREHRLSALLDWHLQQNFPLAAPASQSRRQQFFENNARYLLLSAALLKVMEALHAAGIRALAYKGPALSALLYGDIALREMSDLDILIDRASFSASREVLTGLGYQPAFALSLKQEKARLRSDCECEFTASDHKVMVDLHWQVTAPHLAQRLHFDDLWDRRRAVTLGQKFVPTFSAEDTALILAVHGGKHLWERLSLLADFAESLRQNVDWQALKSRAREARAERMLFLALALAEDIFEIQIPSELSAIIQEDARVQSIAQRIALRLFDDEDREDKDRTDAAESSSRWLTLWQLADNRWDGARSAARFAVGSGRREWQSVRLPDSLFGLYRLLRIASLLRSAPAFFSLGRR